MSATIWHDPVTDEWTVRDGCRVEPISPLVRQALADEHERLTKPLEEENAELWELVLDILRPMEVDEWKC